MNPNTIRDAHTGKKMKQERWRTWHAHQGGAPDLSTRSFAAVPDFLVPSSFWEACINVVAISCRTSVKAKPTVSLRAAWQAEVDNHGMLFHHGACPGYFKECTAHGWFLFFVAHFIRSRWSGVGGKDVPYFGQSFFSFFKMPPLHDLYGTTVQVLYWSLCIKSLDGGEVLPYFDLVKRR